MLFLSTTGVIGDDMKRPAGASPSESIEPVDLNIARMAGASGIDDPAATLRWSIRAEGRATGALGQAEHLAGRGRDAAELISWRYWNSMSIAFKRSHGALYVLTAERKRIPASALGRGGTRPSRRWPCLTGIVDAAGLYPARSTIFMNIRANSKFRSRRI